MVLCDLYGDIACPPMHSRRGTGFGEIRCVVEGLLQAGALAIFTGDLVMCCSSLKRYVMDHLDLTFLVTFGVDGYLDESKSLVNELV